jgi:hypothetical protein
MGWPSLQLEIIMKLSSFCCRGENYSSRTEGSEARQDELRQRSTGRSELRDRQSRRTLRWTTGRWWPEQTSGTERKEAGGGADMKGNALA